MGPRKTDQIAYAGGVAHRKPRSLVKRRPMAQTRGRVTQFFPSDGFGFLETVDGREVYFDESTALEPRFRKLTIGGAVSVSEKYCRSNTVKIAGKTQPLKIREIVVCLDGSAYAESILPYARGIAKSLDAPLTLLSVLDLKSESDLAGYLRAISRRLGIRAKIRQTSGDVADALVEELRNPVSLPALTTQGRGGVSETLFGSVASAIIRRVGRPVLVYRPHVDSSTAKRKAMSRRILNVTVALDGSDFAERILPFAAQLAKRLGARLELLQAAAPTEPYSRNVSESLSYLKAKAGDLPKQFAITVQWNVLRGDPGEAIVAHLKGRRDTVLAMTSHARSGLKLAFLGSVSRECLRRADIPILLFWPKET
jgi:nucleotide-binding universal stress UspA family protein/cold shock CspA family protein